MAQKKSTYALAAIVIPLGFFVAYDRSQAYGNNYVDCENLQLNNSQEYVCVSEMSRGEGLRQVHTLNKIAEREEMWHFDRETNVWTEIGQFSSTENFGDSKYAFEVKAYERILGERVLDSTYSLLVHNHPSSQQEKELLSLEQTIGLSPEDKELLRAHQQMTMSPSDRDIGMVVETYRLAKNENPLATVQSVIVSDYGLTKLEPRLVDGKIKVFVSTELVN